ncbi:hypothetical protein R1flu_008954 [Riccia fluitans]|uniref:Insulin-degrading enzyme-like 1, peroxisomal n=1 Tax=Riccia fluitans TaxID=41844 RepID=A0ABD1Z0P6_9MARC
MGVHGDDAPELLQSLSISDTSDAFPNAPILKPRSDSRSYRRIVLANGLQILLVSDPETDKAAGSMDVHVGSFSDPEELPGLAHFLEHMLFFSSEKYPEEDSFFKYLVEHGGQSNAYTAPEHTNFHFEVGADYLEEALDRFAQFFICPLFAADATSREIKAVDSENSKNLTTDVWRMNQLSRHLSSKDHPFHKFGTGNLDTLEVKPKALGIDTRAELLKFYEARYSSNLMCFAVYGRESLDVLQKLAEEKLRHVNNSMKKVERFPGQPCSAEHLQILVKAVPVKDGHSLTLMWPVSPELHNYREAPSHYIGHLIGHEADGSLFALLKQLGWANSLSAGEMESNLDSAFFSVDIELTDVGQEHMEEVVGFLFQYLSILRKEGVAKWIFEELKSVCDMKFHFQDKMAPVSYVSSLSNHMQLYPPEDWLAASMLPRSFNSGVLSEAIQQLTPERVRIFWHSKQFQDVTLDVEPWYSTRYTCKKIDEKLIKQWQCADADPRLHLPNPNPFIPKDFSLIKNDGKVSYPSVLKKSKMSRLWYKADTRFGTPKACIHMHFNCPESYYSPEASILTRIFTKLLVDYLNAYAYYAEVAGLSYKVVVTPHGFQVSVYGYNDKLIVLTKKIMEFIISFEVKEDRFRVMKEVVMKDCVNFRFQQPYQQALYNCSLLLEHKRWHVNEYIEVLPDLAAEDLRQMFPRILSRVFVECFVIGNIRSEEAELLIDHVETTLTTGPIVKSKAPFSSQLMEQRIVRLEDGVNYIYASDGLNPQDENSALQLYLQVGQEDTSMNILVELLVLTIKEGVFHQLRTVEQLGYLVFVATKNDFGVRGIQFLIQSTVKDPDALEGRVEAFLERYAETLEKMPQQDFQRHVDALIEMKLEKYKNLWEESSFFLREITDGTLKFDRPEVEVAALRKLDKDALIDFFGTYVQRNARRRRTLSLRVYGSQHSGELKALKEAIGDASTTFVGAKNYLQDNGDGMKTEAGEDSKRSQALLIHNISSFKRGQSLYSSLKGGLHPEYKES